MSSKRESANEYPSGTIAWVVKLNVVELQWNVNDQGVL